MRRVLGLLVLAAAVVPASGQNTATSVVLGEIAGPTSPLAPPGVRFYGTDLGWTFEHQGELRILFGDTWPYARFLCDVVPDNDDSQATLPPVRPPAGLPPLTFLTEPGSDVLAPIRLFRGGESLDMGYLRTPLAGFSDGSDAFGLFLRPEYVPCVRRGRRKKASCRPHAHLTCAEAIGRCVPPTIGLSALCDVASGAGCLPVQTCAPSDAGYCFDPSSSQHDGTEAGTRAAAAVVVSLAVADATAPTTWTEIATLPTIKFSNATARAVTRFKGRLAGDDYAPGTGALLVWGRAGFQGAGAREAQLYLFRQTMPLRRGRDGTARLAPRYFAGVDARSGKPRWTRREAQAVPLALDGVVGGSPHEEQPITSQMAITWVGAPISKWVMLYGGDLADYLLVDAANARPGDAPGAMRIRYADRPWGPWTPPEAVLRPGDPAVVGDPNGPGGILFHVACADQGPALCARSDPSRPPDALLPGCPEFAKTFDNGRMYAPNVIEQYTEPDGTGGVNLYWNLSTWNPYAVVLVRTTLRPAP